MALSREQDETSTTPADAGTSEIPQDPGRDDAPAIRDFSSATAAALADLRHRVGLDSWFLARRHGDDHVVLGALDDDALGHVRGLVRPWADTYCARVVAGAAPMAAPDVDRVPAFADARCDCTPGHPVGAFLSVPVRAPDGGVLGTLCATSCRPVPDLGGHLATVQVQAGILGTLLSHELRLADQTRRAEHAELAAATDALTGAANRRAWDRALAAEEERAARYVTPVAVVVLDLDDLKGVNDGEGHDVGDALLRRTAAVLRPALRERDLLARLGGDEFGILLPGTEAREASDLARRLEALLAEAGIGASVGVAARSPLSTVQGAWREADAAMYARKVAAGRDPGGGSRRHGRGAAAPGPATRVVPAPRAHPPATADPDDLRTVDDLLDLVRDQLGMDVAFLSRFDAGRQRLRNVRPGRPGRVRRRGGGHPPRVGDSVPLDQTYCRLVVDGRVPEVLPDVSAEPLVAHLPVTHALGIGSYVGVPVHRSTGQLYGTLCAVSTRPDPSLQPRDAEVLRTVGRIVMSLVEREDRREDGRHEVIARIDDLAARGGPDIVYQPILALDSLEVVGAEALSRFPPGTPPPDEWFSSAAAAGVGEDLELEAVSAAARGLPLLQGRLAINVSPATASSPRTARLLQSLPLHRIVLEVTEHEEVRDYEALHAALRPLREQGLRLAVDDVGAGFASMRHVLCLAPDVVKLDVSLVRDIDADQARRALATALVAFARTTGASVVAEGIETGAELEALRSLGVDRGQGYYLGRPAPLPRST